MRDCPVCGKTYGDDAAVCSVDGAALGPRESTADPLIGRVIQRRYRVLRKLGQGGMGAVYLAEQMSMSRKVALKVLRREYSEHDEFVKRFRQEARLSASLSHPRIATFFDFDQAEDGSLFIAMEYLPGKTLSEIVRQDGALEVKRALRLGAQIAEGLRAAHRAGLIHRDVKPQNVMVMGPDDDVKLMDFGIARLMDQDGTQLTRTGVVMGTPAFMAPEQFSGADVDARADIYALGVVLYEMLAGKNPFRGETVPTILARKLEGSLPRLRLLRPEVPEALEALVTQSLQKDPQARQQDMSAVLDQLRAVEGHGGVAELPTVITERPVTGEIKTARVMHPARRWALPGAGALAVLVVVAMASWSTLRRPADVAAPSPASVPTSAPVATAQQPVAVSQPEPPASDPGRLQASVEDKLREAGLLKTRSDQPGVSVKVDPERVVTLSGVLNDADQLQRAAQLAREVQGVKDVKPNVNLISAWGKQSN